MIKTDSGLGAKKVGISVAVVMLMLLSGAAVLTTPAVIGQDTMGGEYGGLLRVALQGEPNTLNPLASNPNGPAVKVMDLMYESLGRVDPYSLELKPWMASGWTVNTTDSSIVDVVLRSGIQWHDGTPVTVDDVAYTFGPNGYNLDYVDSITTDEASNTITFDLARPDARFYSQLMQMKVVKDGFTAADDPMGCGPFEFVSEDSNTTVLAAFDEHFIARPYLDTIIFTYYPYEEADFSDDYPYINKIEGDDPRWDGTYRAAYDLMSGKIDFIAWGLTTNQTTLNVEMGGNYTTLVLNANATVQGANGLSSWDLGFNDASGHILSDPALRRAIAYAIDKDALTQYDISGGLESTDLVVSKYNVPWYNTSITTYGADMSQAMAVLHDAGYMDYDGDGWVDLPDGTPFSLRLYGPPQEDVTPYTMSTNIMTWFDQLGLNVTLVPGLPEDHMDNILADDFDMYLADVTSATQDPGFLEDLYMSGGIAADTNILNFAGEYTVTNESLMEGLDNQTWTVPLTYTNIADPVTVYHNGTLVDNSSYTVDYAAGTFTVDQSFALDYLNDTLTITYNYRPVDHYLELASKQMDPQDRARYIKSAEGVISDLVPDVPLFSYKVNHAYRTNVYVGWVNTLGGIDNYWTYTGLKNEIVGDLDVSLSSFKNYATEGESMNLIVKVQDMNGAPVEDASITLTGEGTFGDPVYDPDGQQFNVQYTAPVTEVSRTVTITVSAYAAGYTSASDTMDITVHPGVGEFIVEIDRGDASLDSGNTTDITVTVMDKSDGSPISGATVVLDLSPAGLGGYLADLSGTTDSAGEFATTFSSNNVTVDTTFRITAYVTMDGFQDAEQVTSIAVSRDPNIQAAGQGSGFLGLPAPSMLMVLITLASMSVVYAVYRRRRY